MRIGRTATVEHRTWDDCPICKAQCPANDRQIKAHIYSGQQSMVRVDVEALSQRTRTLSLPLSLARSLSLSLSLSLSDIATPSKAKQV